MLTKWRVCVKFCTIRYISLLSDMSGDDENAEFFVKLSQLRSHAEVYLSMLNDMRRRLKEIPPDATTAQQYRY